MAENETPRSQPEKSYRAYLFVGLLVALLLAVPSYQYLTGHAGGDQGCGGFVDEEISETNAKLKSGAPMPYYARARPLGTHTIRLTAAQDCVPAENETTCSLEWSEPLLNAVADIADSARTGANILAVNFKKNGTYRSFRKQLPNMPFYAKNMGKLMAYENPQGRHPLSAPWELSSFRGRRDDAMSASMTTHDPKDWAMETKAGDVTFTDADGTQRTEWRPALFAVDDIFPIVGVGAWNKPCAPNCPDPEVIPPWRYPRPFRYPVQIRDSKVNTYQLGEYCGKRTAFGVRRKKIELTARDAIVGSGCDDRFYLPSEAFRRVTCAPSNEIVKGSSNGKCAMGAGAFCSPALLRENEISPADPLIHTPGVNSEGNPVVYKNGDYRRDGDNIVFNIGYQPRDFENRAIYRGQPFSAEFRKMPPAIQDFPCYAVDPSKAGAAPAYRDGLERVLRETGAPGMISDDIGGHPYVPSSRAFRGEYTVLDASRRVVGVRQAFQFRNWANKLTEIRYMPASPSPNPGEKYQMAGGYGNRSWHYRPAFDDKADPPAAFAEAYIGFLQRMVRLISEGTAPFSWMPNFSTLDGMLTDFSPNLAHGYPLTQEIFSLGMWHEKWNRAIVNDRELRNLKLHAAREASRANRPAVLTTRIFNFNDTDIDLTSEPAIDPNHAVLPAEVRHGHSWAGNLESALVDYLLVLEEPSITLELVRNRTFDGPGDLHTFENLVRTLSFSGGAKRTWLRAILDLNAGYSQMKMGRIGGLSSKPGNKWALWQSRYAVMYRKYQNLLVMRNVAKDGRAIRVELPNRICPKSNPKCDRSYYYLRQKPWGAWRSNDEAVNKGTWNKMPLPLTCRIDQGYDFDKANRCASKLFQVSACADPNVVASLDPETGTRADDPELDCNPLPTTDDCDGEYCIECKDDKCSIFYLEQYQPGDVVFIAGNQGLLLFHEEAIPFFNGQHRLIPAPGKYLRSPKDFEAQAGIPADGDPFKLCVETESSEPGSRCTQRVEDNLMLNAKEAIKLDPNSDPDMLAIPPGM
jgi:hypothetical protein